MIEAAGVMRADKLQRRNTAFECDRSRTPGRGAAAPEEYVLIAANRTMPPAACLLGYRPGVQS
jgi:hypothetical protein